MITQMAERPPHVAFEVRAEEFVNAEGHRSFRDVDFAIVTPHGGNLIVERPALEWLQAKRDEGSPFYDAFKRAYDAWKEGQEPPVDGTPLAAATCFTPAEVKQAQAAGVRSIEDLAAFPDGQLGRLGMGGRKLKDKAAAWLASHNDTGRIAEELAALKVTAQQLADAVTDRDEKIKELEAQIKALSKTKG
ncbi:hypothetical protein [Azospirillum sp. sgz302134]